MCFISDPSHVRAANNKRYYEEIIEEEEKKKLESSDSGTADSEKDTLTNERQLDDYRKSSDFSSYEALCRGEDTHVSHWSAKLISLPCLEIICRRRQVPSITRSDAMSCRQ